jgi:GntR family transcriptional regulator, transcriptional repressor for pyruvate dehydrogenase complex
MPLQTIEPRRLYRQIADQLRVLIEGSEFAAGTRLPPERDLATQLGVSRPSVREALIALEVEGLVEVRMGSGVYVRSVVDGQATRKVTGEGPLEIIRARQLIETELAALAARHMKKPQVAALRDAVRLMEEEAGAGHTPTQGDRLFHTRIAEASNNSVLLRVVTELFDERRNPLFEQLGSHFETATSWAAAIAEHRRVVDAIAARAPQAAREAMSLHLSNSHDRFTAKWPTRAGATAAAAALAATPAAPRAATRRATPRAPVAKTFA